MKCCVREGAASRATGAAATCTMPLARQPCVWLQDCESNVTEGALGHAAVRSVVEEREGSSFLYTFDGSSRSFCPTSHLLMSSC